MTQLTPDSPLVDENALAAALGMSIQWLRHDRQNAQVLPFFKLGKSCRYSLDRCREALVALEHGGPAPRGTP